MDTNTSIELLVRELVRIGDINVIADSDAWKKRKENSYIRDTKSSINETVLKFTTPEELEEQVTQRALELPANYFVGRLVGVGEGAFFHNIPYRLIGQREKEVLREHFYKDVRSELKDAMRTLNIPHFAEIYALYVNSEPGHFFDALYDKIRVEVIDPYEQGVRNQSSYPLLEGDVAYLAYKGSKGYIQLSYVSTYRGACSGKTFKDPFCAIPVSKDKEIELRIKDILPLKQNYRLRLITEFPRFVFSLPEEDRNLDADREILTTLADKLPIEHIMMDTYRNFPQLFMDYFPVIEGQKQITILRDITLLPEIERQKSLDEKLFDPTYTGPHPEYVWFAQSNPQEFMEIFGELNLATQEDLISHIYHMKDLPEGLADTLSTRYPALVEEIGIHYVTQEEEEDA